MSGWLFPSLQGWWLRLTHRPSPSQLFWRKRSACTFGRLLGLGALHFMLLFQPSVPLQAQAVGESNPSTPNRPTSQPTLPPAPAAAAAQKADPLKPKQVPKGIQSPKHFQRIWYAHWRGRQALLFLPPALQVAPVLADLNGDGALDLLLGSGGGQLSVLLQEKGARSNASVWRVSTRNLQVWPKGVPASSKAAWEQSQRISPGMADFDGDGDLDLVVGGDKGMLWMFTNVGDHVQPLFVPQKTYSLSPSMQGQLAPILADVNDDGVPDLLIGDGRGQVWLALNQRNLIEGGFCLLSPPPDALPSDPLPCSPSPQRIYQNPNPAPISPLVVDWDGDGLKDLFLGLWNGRVTLLRNQGTRITPRWVLRASHFQGIDAGGHAAPAGGDVNQDGLPDLILGSAGGKVRAYVRSKNNPFDVWLWKEDLLEVVSLGRRGDALRMAAGDIDGDGDLDLLVGKDFGEMFWLENRGSKTRIDWWPNTTWLSSQVHRPWAAPALADLDGDGDIDGLVGGERGGLWLLRNHGKKKGKAQPLTPEGVFIQDLPVGMRFHPAAADIDKDGDVDVVLAFENGHVLLALNTGIATSPRYVLQKKPLVRLNPARWSPTMTDVTGDGNIDILLGAPNQSLHLLSRTTSNAATWRVVDTAWGPKDAKGGAPVLADFTGNGVLDLMLADDEGAISFWRGRAASAAHMATQINGKATP